MTMAIFRWSLIANISILKKIFPSKNNSHTVIPRIFNFPSPSTAYKAAYELRVLAHSKISFPTSTNENEENYLKARIFATSLAAIKIRILSVG